MSYWLFKSEPGEFGIDDLAGSPKKTTCWDGVRNYQARNFMRDAMKIGDLGLFYHSNCDVTGVTGIVRIVQAAYPDHTAFDTSHKHFDPKSDKENPRWFMVDVQLVRKLDRVVTLAELKQYGGYQLSGLALLQRGSRLSVMPVRESHWNFILACE
jgi:predicted RNA-binding protein with PUA-like domain